LADYISTYVQRDVRQVINIGDLLAFSGFLKLCAGRTGQEINLSSIGSDAGISHNTARAWLSILETSYIISRLPAWHGNIRRQLVKAPKLHFFDSGLVCQLLGIREPEQLRHHPLRGAIFESWVVAELYKGQSNSGKAPDMFHYRESRGPEIDLLINQGDILHAIEIKSGATVSMDFFKHFQSLAGRLIKTSMPAVIKNHVIYGGEDSQQRTQAQLLSWRNTLQLL
jgi:predicted AAA+ superfamily ATPase